MAKSITEVLQSNSITHLISKAENQQEAFDLLIECLESQTNSIPKTAVTSCFLEDHQLTIYCKQSSWASKLKLIVPIVLQELQLNYPNIFSQSIREVKVKIKL